MKQRIIDAGFAFFGATGLHERVAPWTRGRGAILTLHHVRPWVERSFAPNRSLEIEPGFLDAALGRVRALGYDLVTMDEALLRLREPEARPFVALTLDDGYRDLVEHALPSSSGTRRRSPPISRRGSWSAPRACGGSSWRRRCVRWIASTWITPASA